jgi:hypothetical protein
MPETNLSPTVAQEIDHYVKHVSLDEFLPINTGLHPAEESTMVSTLGSPLMPLTTTDQPDRASPMVKEIGQTINVSQHIIVTGIKPAVESLKSILLKVFTIEKENGHDFESVLGTDGMLNVRLRKPTSGKPSTRISNHAWGTAIDFKIIRHGSPGDTGHTIPRFISVLLPHFNEAGWYSGIGFHDTMHFEVSDETIRQWLRDGLFKS